MKRFIKIFSLILAILMIFSLTACADRENDDAKDSSADDTDSEAKESPVVVKTENFEVTSAMMEYFFKEKYNSYVSEMSYYIQLGYIKLDTGKSLKTQIQSESGTTTWFDYFMDITTTRVSQILAYCEGAHKEGIALNSEEKAEIEAEIEALYETAEQYADMYGMSVQKYMASTYGKHVTQNDIRAAMTIEKLASKYADILYGEFCEEITAEDINKYYNENSEDYITADYLSYKFEVTKDTVKESDYNGDTAAYEQAKKWAEEKYEAVKADAKKKAEELLAKTNAEDFKAHIKANLEQDYKIKGDDNMITLSEQKEIDKKMNALFTENAPLGYESDLDCWLFGIEKDGGGVTEAAKMGDKKLFEDTSRDEYGSYTITVCFVVREAGRNETITKNIFYAAFSDTCKTEAEALVTEFGATAKDFATFEALANAKGATIVKENPNNGKGDFGYDEIDEWLFSANTGAGALKNIALVNYNVVVYVVGDGDPQWYSDVFDALTDERSEAWIQKAVNDLNLSYDTKLLNDIDA